MQETQESLYLALLGKKLKSHVGDAPGGGGILQRVLLRVPAREAIK